MSPSMSISANPFIPVKVSIINYSVTKPIDSTESKKIEELIQQTAGFIKLIKTLPPNSKKIAEFFSNLLFVKKAAKYSNLKYKSILDIKSLKSVNSGIVYKNLGKYDSTDFAWDPDAEQYDELSNNIKETAYNIFSTMLIKQMSDAQTILGFVKQYPSLKDVQKNKFLWKIYNKLKKSLQSK